MLKSPNKKHILFSLEILPNDSLILVKKKLKPLTRSHNRTALLSQKIRHRQVHLVRPQDRRVLSRFFYYSTFDNTTQSSLQAELRSIRQELLLNWCFLCKCCFHAFSHMSFESINKQASSSPQSQHVEHAKLFIPSASIRSFSWASLITLCLFSTLGTVFLLKITIGLNFDPSAARANKQLRDINFLFCGVIFIIRFGGISKISGVLSIFPVTCSG